MEKIISSENLKQILADVISEQKVSHQLNTSPANKKTSDMPIKKKKKKRKQQAAKEQNEQEEVVKIKEARDRQYEELERKKRGNKNTDTERIQKLQEAVILSEIIGMPRCKSRRRIRGRNNGY